MEEEPRDGQYVLAPFPQRRNMKANLGETMIQIAAEFATLGGSFQVLIRSGHNTRVYGDFAYAAEPEIGHAIEHP